MLTFILVNTKQLYKKNQASFHDLIVHSLNFCRVQVKYLVYLIYYRLNPEAYKTINIWPGFLCNCSFF